MSANNDVKLIGRLTADVEIKRTTSNTEVTTFTLAINRKTKDKKTDFITVKAWGHTALFIKQWFTKGKLMAVQGELRSDDYTDKNGQKRKSFYILVTDVSFCGNPTKESPDDLQPRPDEEDPFTEITDEVLPF